MRSDEGAIDSAASLLKCPELPAPGEFTMRQLVWTRKAHHLAVEWVGGEGSHRDINSSINEMISRIRPNSVTTLISAHLKD
jgi:hypothetical protein